MRVLIETSHFNWCYIYMLKCSVFHKHYSVRILLLSFFTSVLKSPLFSIMSYFCPSLSILLQKFTCSKVINCPSNLFFIWFTEDLILLHVSCITLTIPTDKMGKRKGKSVRKNKQVKEKINLNRVQFSMYPEFCWWI